MNKKLLSILLAGVLTFGIIGCSNQEKDKNPSKEGVQAEVNKESEKSVVKISEERPDRKDINVGVFEDKYVRDRELSDYMGEWQSVYPYLQDGTLDPVFESKAKKAKEAAKDGDKKPMDAAEYKAYYDIGYKTDVEKIEIKGDEVTFYENGKKATGTYAYDRFEILTYSSGKKGVRYLFTKESGDDNAPKFIQFSDHEIYPIKAAHFHIFPGDTSHEEILEEMENWPTYYRANLSGGEIVEEILHH